MTQETKIGCVQHDCAQCQAKALDYARLLEKHNNLHMNARAHRERVEVLERAGAVALHALRSYDASAYISLEQTTEATVAMTTALAPKPQAFPSAVNEQITDSVTQSAAPCPRCGKANPADVHTCTPAGSQITDNVTQSATPCEHQQVMTWVFDDGVPAMWSCASCRVKFVPLLQLNAEVAAEREACAKACEELEQYKGHACAYAIRARGNP